MRLIDRMLSTKFKRKHELIMTLLVRDEEDIIELNIKHHLSKGVDFIIATDNGSKDGTAKILKKYESIGKLHYIFQAEDDYNQAVWVNSMGRLAKEKYGAKYIFHCDADEFWTPKQGNLKYEISQSDKKIPAYFVELENVLPVYKEKNNYREDFFDNLYVIKKPIISNNLLSDSKNKGIYFFKYPPKVMYSIENEYMDVTQGNHNFMDSSIEPIFSLNLHIYHFPVRGWDHFKRKVIQGGQSYENNKSLPRDAGFHWRRWYEAYKVKRLEDEYKKLIISSNSADSLLGKGIIEKFNNKDIL